MATGSTANDIHALLKKHWGHDTFRPMQEEVIRSVLNGKDTLALMPTGGGKSICFQLPALASGKLCLVISPLIALMKDQVGRLKEQGIPARALVSGMSYAEMDNALESAAVGRLSFLYVSPERLSSDLFQARVQRMSIGLIAVDEAHCISQWGYDFRPAYMKLAELRDKLPMVPVLALTATATKQVAEDIMVQLRFPGSNLLRSSFHRPELVFWVSHGEDRSGRLLRILNNVSGSSIVYVRDRRGTVRIARFLEQHGINAEAYHAGMSASDRDRTQKQWTSGAVRCVVATNAFGMGIDKSDVRSVIHLDVPPDLESYYQEAGRAGRDGKAAYAFLLTGPGDEEKLCERLAQSFPSLLHVRRVYQALADLHGIALGSGLLESYSVDLDVLSDRTGLRQVVVAHSLKALELDGRITLSDGVHSPSRVLIVADHRVIYRMRVEDQRMGPLLEALLRLYGGLFEEPSMIDESRLAKLIDRSARDVIDRLTELDKLRVISYRPRNDSPTATLLQPRQDAERLTIEPAALRMRQERAEKRMLAMVHYVNATDQCRSKLLLIHFNETNIQDCGECDVCQGRSALLLKMNAKTSSSLSGSTALAESDMEELRVDIDDGHGFDKAHRPT